MTESPRFPGPGDTRTEESLREMLPTAPPVARRDDRWLFGRYRTAIAHPGFDGGWLWRLRLKQWHYSSVSTDELFFAFGVVHLGFAANLFAYVIEHESGRVWELEDSLPGTLGLRMAPSSVRGVTRWRWGAQRVVIERHREGEAGTWQVKLDLRFLRHGGPRGMDGLASNDGVAERVGKSDRVTSAPEPLRFISTLTLDDVDAMALLYDLGDGRAAYTHKAAGLPVRGTALLGSAVHDLHGGLATLDWTRSLANRETRWKWASFASHQGGRRIGLNLSAEVYDDAEGVSLENAYWIDGDVHPLGAVSFALPETDRRAVDPWVIRSADGRVDLTFSPLGARSQRVDLRVLRSAFVQPYGTFEGTLDGHRIDQAFGVVEDHQSVW